MHKKKIIAVASIGGHWIQLLRIAKPLEAYYDVIYMSTMHEGKVMVSNATFYSIPDFNRWETWKMVPAAFKILTVLRVNRPSAIISTGAAPGLLTILIGYLFGIKTIWIDSVANVQAMSLSGRLAKIFSKHVYTQWPDLATNKVKFAGNIFGNNI